MRLANQTLGVDPAGRAFRRGWAIAGIVPSAMTCSGGICSCDDNGSNNCSDKSACKGHTMYCSIDLNTGKQKCSCNVSRFGSLHSIFGGSTAVVARRF